MAEAFLQILIENLTCLIEGEIGLIMGVNKEMKKLSNTLTTIQKVLEDAEDKQFQSKAIQNWLSKLNEIAFEIEDILDECATEASKLKKHKGSRFNFIKKILYNHKIGRRMKEVAEKLDGIAADRHNFHFREVIVQQTSHVDWRRETGSVVNEPDHIYGRDEDKDKIVDVLLNQVADCENLSVLPIIGVGGLGKTTLAQLVYNDERVSLHFETKLWVCVSDNFDLKILVEAMIESATGSAPNLKHMDALQLRLREVLNDKKYLLILDDVWNENQEDWVKLKSMLAYGSKGSSIVVTTRLPKVGDIMRTLPAYWLKELLEEHCWLLFRLRAFGQENGQQHPKLESIGRQIVKKCGGVPLAAKALGGLLRFKREEKEWIHIKESEIWNLPEEEISIFSVLRLSYRHLPFILKRCFVYCAVFPKDFVIDKQDLIFRWMAHGCITSNEKLEVEDVGDQIWNELVLRSFFQQVHILGTRTTFKMHDLIHDLAQSIMENKHLGAQTKSSSISASNNKIREVHWRKYSDQTSSSSITLQVSTLTTIISYNHLRILKLVEVTVKELPSSIGKLKHLRNLDLSYSTIHTLPRTFCGIWNLQTLILTNCRSLKSLPKNIRCMNNLRHIFLEGCSSLSHMPSRIRELTSLKTLSLFIVGYKIGNQLDELEHLNLGGTLEIKHLERVGNHLNAKKANLVEKPYLRKLVLHWGGESTLAKMMDGEEKVLEALEPHVNLESLEIYGFKGGQFPFWMTKMENLTELTIEYCPNCSHLPPLGGLPRLRSLHLKNVDALEFITFNGKDEIGGQNSIFPSLEFLELKYLRNLKGLLKKEVGEIMFPTLERLHISDCELLILPPLSLSALKELNVRKCSLLTLSSFFDCKLQNLSYLRLEFDNINNYTTTKCNVPEDTMEGLCNLKNLSIHNAGQQGLLEKWFRGLKSVTKLDLYECKIESCFAEGWLRHLTALEELSINSCSELVIALEEIQYLHLLRSLSLVYVDEMVSLPQGLQHIQTLQSLSLHGLSELTSLPDWLGNLTSLIHLRVTNCPKLPSLPSTIKGITNLSYLRIQGCPQLERRCEKEKGEDWHIIAHIPQLQIWS